jgi:hypothetical protein
MRQTPRVCVIYNKVIPNTEIECFIPHSKNLFVTRQDLATVFQHDPRLPNRTMAVTALKKLGSASRRFVRLCLADD